MLLWEAQEEIIILAQLDQKLLFFDIAYSVIVSCSLRSYEKQYFILYTLNRIIIMNF